MSLWKLLMLASEADCLEAERRLGGDTGLEAGAVARFEAKLPLWSLEAFFDERPDDMAVARLVEGLEIAGPVQVEAVGEENWVAFVERTLSPVAAGRFVVHGPHDREQVRGHPYAIEIEAGEAFGTAHHATTQGCLAAIDRIVPQSGAVRALDLGTGSGVLAIAIARVAPGIRVLASDIDPRSAEIARENAGKNGAGEAVEVIVADGLDHPRMATAAPFGFIVANILAAPLIALAPAIVAALAPGGRIVLSGLLATQSAEVAAAYRAAGARVIADNMIGEWATLELAR